MGNSARDEGAPAAYPPVVTSHETCINCGEPITRDGRSWVHVWPGRPGEPVKGPRMCHLTAKPGRHETLRLRHQSVVVAPHVSGGGDER